MTPNDNQKFQLARARRQRLKELEENHVFLQFLEEIRKAKERAEAKHEDPELTAEKRAEWLWAMKQTRELAEWFSKQRAEVEEILKKAHD